MQGALTGEETLSRDDALVPRRAPQEYVRLYVNLIPEKVVTAYKRLPI